MPESGYEIILGLGFALMAGAAIIALLRPLRSPAAPSKEPPHLAFYRDQLDEIERDLARGVLAADEAEAARSEVARRLLAAEDQAAAPKSGSALRRHVALIIMIATPLLALGLYLAKGSPELRDEPFASRVEGALDQLPLDALIYRVSQRLKENPDDLKGWEVIAPGYSDLGRYRDAAHAWERAIELGGPTATRLVNLGEARMSDAAGDIGEAERRIFMEAEKLDPLDPRAQYYLGLADIQNGQGAKATERWQLLLDTAPKEAPWRAGIQTALDRLRASTQAASVAAPPVDEQSAMIESMVAGLAARLEQNPQDIEGWLRLIKSYGVLKKRDEANAALARARKVFEADKQALVRLDAAEKALKSPSSLD